MEEAITFKFRAAQAISFWSAIAGVIGESDEEAGLPRSPEAFASLEALFGRGELPTPEELEAALNNPTNKIYKTRRRLVVEFFRAMAEALAE